MIPKKNIKRALIKYITQPRYAFRNFTRRLNSSLSYHLYNGVSYWPETISLFLTYACNLRCYMCGQWENDGAFKNFDKKTVKNRLTLEEIKVLINEVKHFKPNITLFGGEPTLYPNWVKVLEIVKSAGLKCNIVTNGVNLSRWAEEIVNLELDEIIFSLDGPEEIHNKIRRVPGTFKKSINGFHSVNNLKRAKDKKKPLININCTINEENYLFIDETISIAESIEADVLTFHHLLFLDTKTVTRFVTFFQKLFGQTPSDWSGFVIDNPPKIDVDVLIKKIHAINDRKNKTKVSFYPNFSDSEIRQWYTKFSFKANSYKNRCLSLWMTTYIFPDGSVRHYHTMNFSPGNIKFESFKNIWNNDLYKKYRNYIKKNKSFEVCTKGCTEFFRY